jgi:hypothetical protein
MALYSLQLINKIATFNNSEGVKGSSGFIFKCNGIKYIITTHHYLPIIYTNLEIGDGIIPLKKIKNINWNDLNIFEFPEISKSDTTLKCYKELANKKIVKSFRTKFEKKNNEIKICDQKYPIYDYYHSEKSPFCKIKNIYMRFYIGKYKDTNINKFKGSSGSPVFSTDGRLIGIFCKYMIEEEHILGIVLPTIYILKSIQKNDNLNTYKLNFNSLDNLKIGNYEIQKEYDDYYIYHPSIKYKLPIDIYYNLEGDKFKYVEIKNTVTKNNMSKQFINNNDFDISINLIQTNERNTYKFNYGLISILFSLKYTNAIKKIINNYLNCKSLNNIYINFDPSDFS